MLERVTSLDVICYFWRSVIVALLFDLSAFRISNEYDAFAVLTVAFIAAEQEQAVDDLIRSMDLTTAVM